MVPVDLNLDDAIRGCDEGLFEVIDPSELAPGTDGSTPQEDYYPDMLNSRIFNAQVLENQPFVIIWDGQVLDFGQLAVLAGTPRLDAAMRFIEFVSRPSSMARVGRYIAYSPARRSAEALVTTHFGTGMEMRPHMPNTPEHTGRAVHSDAVLSSAASDIVENDVRGYLTA